MSVKSGFVLILQTLFPYSIIVMTFLFDKVVFGPVYSRRLGISLGINLLPTGLKYCTFNCIYCECGWTKIDITDRFLSRLCQL